MRPIDSMTGLMPTILDRLIDPNSAGTDARRGYGLAQMLEIIRRDLEELLNTRQSISGMDPRYSRVLKSIIAYGLPDLTSFNAVTPDQRQDIARKLEEIIAQFEPRLRNIRVQLREGEVGNRPAILCHIDGRLAVDPAPEVAFDTIMETTTGQHRVIPKEK